MIHIIEKIVDHCLSRSIKNKVIIILISSGVGLIVQTIAGQIFEAWLIKTYQINLPDLKFWGLGLIFLGLMILYHDIKYSLIPSVFSNIKTSRSIYLGENKYQFVFDEKMRCAPTICFISPKHKENLFYLSNWDENGFIVQFENGKSVPYIDFWADAWEGLNYRQTFYLKLVNVFRKKENRIKNHKCEKDFAERNIKKIKDN